MKDYGERPGGQEWRWWEMVRCSTKGRPTQISWQIGWGGREGEKKREMEDDFEIFAINNWKDRAAISRLMKKAQWVDTGLNNQI